MVRLQQPQRVGYLTPDLSLYSVMLPADPKDLRNAGYVTFWHFGSTFWCILHNT